MRDGWRGVFGGYLLLACCVVGVPLVFSPAAFVGYAKGHCAPLRWRKPAPLLAFSWYTCYTSYSFTGLVMSLCSIFSRFSTFAFSGSRSCVPSGCATAAAFVPPQSVVLVGCQRGVDAYFRSAFPHSSVFSAASFGSGRSSFARRSIALVRSAHATGALFVSFPSAPCPPGLVPSAKSSECFCGLGSGSWATLALALGCGVPCLVFVGCESWLPQSWLWGWGLLPVAGYPGWFACPAARGVQPAVSQLALF